MSNVPLIRSDVLGNNIVVLFEGAAKPSTCCKKTGKWTLNGTSTLLVISNKLPFIPIALLIPYMGIPVTVGTFIGFGILEFWAFQAITEPLVNTIKEGLVPISKSDQTRRKVFIAGTAYILGLGAQIPISLSAAKYDPDGLKIVGFLVSEIVGAFIPALSLKMAFESNLPRRYKEDTEKKLYQLYLYARELVANNRKVLTEMGYQKQLDFINSLESIKTMQVNEKTKSSLYAQKILGSIDQANAESSCKRVFSYPVKFVGAALATSFLYASARFSYDASTATIHDHLATGITFAAAGVLSNAFIMYAALNGTLMKAYDSFCSLITCSYKPSLADQVRPKLSFVLKSGLFVADILATGIIYQIWNDYFSDSSTQQIYFIATNCLSIFLLLFTATLDVTDDIIYQLQKKSNPEDFHSKLVELNEIFKKIEEQLLYCPLDKFALFLNNTPRDMKNNFINRFQLTQSDLTHYIENLDNVDFA